MNAPCPYVGLQPFREEDYPYFFGRERDIRVISSNLLAQPLTVLYGPSGVGKSSVLRAGVLPHLRANVDGAIVYYNSWQSESFLGDLTDQCRTALKVNQPDAGLETLAVMSGRRLFLLLDQFEELMLYHERSELAARFDTILAKLVNRQELTVNVLIGIREDALAGFDQRYSIRVADLLGNTLPLDHLSYEAGRRAVLGPLDVFNRLHRVGGAGYSIEPELVDEVLRQVQVRRFAEMETITRDAPPAAGGARVEAPFLQLVLRRLWEAELSANSEQIRVETLRKIGGARQIVEQHVNGVLSRLPGERDREIAAGMFTYLVTPSRSKISQATADLIDYAGAPESDVRHVLVWLSDKPESRILRRLDNPERYEIFHDVLAQPILDWRRRFFSDKEALDRERKQKEEAARTKREVWRLRRMLAAMALLVLVAGGLAWYALAQRMRAQEAATKLLEATNRGQGDRDRTREAEALARAKEAEADGQTDVAVELRRIAEEARQQALESDRRAAEARSALASAAEDRDRNYREALQQVGVLERDRAQLQDRVKALENELEQLKARSSQSGSSSDREREQSQNSTSNVAVQGSPAKERFGRQPGILRKTGDMFRDCDDCPAMVVVLEDEFTMGSPVNDDERGADQGPTHPVRVELFALGKYEVTRAQFQTYVNEAAVKITTGCNTWKGKEWGTDAKSNWQLPGLVQTPNDPVVCVSWNDADGYVKWLSQKTKQTYRLPSEAEWEYAARAGTVTRRFWGDTAGPACGFENVSDETAKAKFGWPTEFACKDGYVYTAPIGRFRPNGFGLHDVLGNVSEWIQDCYHVNYDGAPASGTAWTTGDCRERVFRGGSWNSEIPWARTAYRNRRIPSFRDSDLGFRVARSLP